MPGPAPEAGRGAPSAVSAQAGVSPLALFMALAFLVTVDTRIMTPLLPTMAASLGTTVAAMTAYMLPYGLCQLLYGPLADRFGPIRVVRAAALGFGAGTLAMGQVSSVLMLDGLRFVTGVFAAAVIPLTLVYIGDSVPYAERQGTIGRLVAVNSIALSLSAAIGGTVAHFVSWRALFVGVGAAAAVPALLLFASAASPPPAAPGRAGLDRYARLLRQRAARLLFAVVGLEGLFLWGGFTYLGAVAVERFGLNELQVGLLIAVYGVAVLVGGFSLARVRSLVSERHLAGLGGALNASGYLLLVPHGSVPVFALGLALIGAGYLGLHTTLQTRATELAPDARGTAVALFALSLFMGGSVGSAVFGPLVEHGWHRLFLSICGLTLLGLGALAVQLLRRAPEAV
jgi:predicted MFS family arabinose efflux permease